MNQESKVPRVKRSVAELSSSNLLDSRRLFYFCHVARLGSLSTAEAVLSVAQSAISRQIQQLEAELGEQLLMRTGRGVTLTPAGELLYKQAEVILQEMSTTIEMLEQAKRQPGTMQIAIASPPAFSNVYMPEVVERFVKAFPDVYLVAYEASTGQVHDYLATGKVDLAIVLNDSGSQKLSTQKLVVEPLMLIASPQNPIAKEKTITRERLLELDMVLPAAPHGSRSLIEAYFREADLQMDPMLRIDSLGMIKAILKNNRYCTILPLVACAREVTAGELIAIPLNPVLKRTVYLGTMRDRPQSPPLKALAREIANVVRAKISSGN